MGWGTITTSLTAQITLKLTGIRMIRQMRAMRHRILFLSFIFGAGLLPAPSAHAAIHLASFDAFEYGFRGPDRIPPGLTTIQIVNKGKELHHIQILKLGKGKTAKDFTAAMNAAPTRSPAWVHFLGGPNAVVPGDQAATSQRLTSGTYLLVCVIPDTTGTPHFARGMIKTLIVSAGDAPPTPVIRPDVIITQLDFRFALSTPITAGTRTVQVINQGTQVHEVVVVRLPAGGSIKDFAEAFTPGAPLAGPPPGTPIGGLTGIEGGAQGWFTMTFTPGRYGLVCFSSNPETGAPHFTKGMLTEFDVKEGPSAPAPAPGR